MIKKQHGFGLRRQRRRRAGACARTSVGRRLSECRRHAPPFEATRTGRTSIRRIHSGYCARRAMAHAMAMHRVLCRLRCHRPIATCDRRERDGCERDGERDGGGPNFLSKLVPGHARARMELCQKECSRSRGIAPPSCMVHGYVGGHSIDRRWSTRTVRAR